MINMASGIARGRALSPTAVVVAASAASRKDVAASRKVPHEWLITLGEYNRLTNNRNNTLALKTITTANLVDH